MKFTEEQMLHVGIVTADIRETAERWSRLLDVPMPEIRTLDARIEYRGTPVTAGLAVALFPRGDSAVELLQPTDNAPSVWRETLDTAGEGLHHIAFAVERLDETIAGCLRDGMTLLQRGTFRQGRYAYLDDRKNTRTVFELMEYE